MPIRATCEACESSFLVKDELAGRLGKCPRCGETFRVPGGAGDVDHTKASSESVLRIDLADSSVGKSGGSDVGRAPSRADRLTPSANGKPGAQAEKKSGLAAVPIWAWTVGGGGVLLIALAAAFFWPKSTGQQVAQKPVAQQPTKPSAVAAKTGKPSRFDDSHLPELKKPKPGATDQEILEYVQHAIVKIDVFSDTWNPHGSLGSGFIIDKERLLVATNFHVVQGAVKADVLFHNGVRFGVEGFVAVQPEHDLAIIKLNGSPKQIAALPLRGRDDAATQSEVFAIGHPHGYAFVVTRGRVNMTTPTRRLPEKDQRWMRQQKLDEENLWVMHDAKIEPGNSGGPLVNTEGEVLGINTLLIRGETGFRNLAIHAKHLQEMFATAKTQPTPLERLPEKEPEKIAIDDLKEVYDEAAKSQWKPKDRDQMQDLIALAGYWSRAKLLLAEKPLLFQALHEGSPRAWQAEIDRIQSVWQKVAWDEAHIQAINSHAKMNGPVFTFCAVEGVTQGKGQARPALQFSVIGRETKALVLPPGGGVTTAKGARFLVVGFARTVQAGDPENPQDIALIQAAALLPLATPGK